MPYIILDRDGVINYDSMEYIKSPDEWIAIPGSLEAIAQLNRAGFTVLVATNQSGVARGYYDLETLSLIHEKMQRELAEVGGYIEEIFYCPHHPDEKCNCRKPQPGMFFNMQKKYQFDFANTFFIGDNLSDVQVAQKIGCPPLLVLTGKGQQMFENHPELKSVLCFADLKAVVQYILTHQAQVII
jgi:D-glycero-D-manno-heptose 1,7-bisphosphate phosphatase